MPNIIKVSAETWVETARRALIEQGLDAIKVDRLAKSLGVSRGGFYHHFENRNDLLDKLLANWATSNDFLPQTIDVQTPPQAADALETFVKHLIAEKDFSPAFEMAIREWARIDSQVRLTVDKVDKHRIKRMSDLFSALGYDANEASIRARVLYFHQIGYYSLGYQKRQSKAKRIKEAPTYLRILCGQRYVDALRKKVKN